MSEIANRKSSVTPASLVSVREVTKTFRMGDSTVTVLRDCDFDVGQGEFVAIEGRSGSGKSTLLHLLAGLDAPDSGSVMFDGQDIAVLARRVEQARTRHAKTKFGSLLMKARAPVEPAISLFKLIANSGPDLELARLRNRHFGFVFQFYHLLPELNVLENTMIGAMIESSTASWATAKLPALGRAKELLGQMGLSHRLTHRPNQLSGGERQRVAIARALMNQPKVLYADEPTGNLDAETGRQIMDVLERLHRDFGQTIVMVTHDRSLAREADRALILRDGKLIAG